MYKFIFLIPVLLSLSGCFHLSPKEQPKITFQQAMKDIASGLKEFETDNQDKKKTFGLVPSEIEATFNISVDMKNSNETSISIDPTSVVKEITSIGSKWTSEHAVKRGNQITIKFRNLLFSKKGEAVYDQKDIAKRIKDLQDAGIIVKSFNPYTIPVARWMDMKFAPMLFPEGGSTAVLDRDPLISPGNTPKSQ